MRKPHYSRCMYLDSSRFSYVFKNIIYGKFYQTWLHQIFKKLLYFRWNNNKLKKKYK